MIARQAIRRFMTSAIRRGGHDDPGGYVGANQPVNLNQPTWLFVLKASIFLGSGFTLPFLVTRHQLLKD